MSQETQIAQTQARQSSEAVSPHTLTHLSPAPRAPITTSRRGVLQPVDRRWFGSVSTSSAEDHEVDGAELQGAVESVGAAQPGTEALSRARQTEAGVNGPRLCDRIAACISLYAGNSRGWAVSMRLSTELAPASRMRLARDEDGLLTLLLQSTEPAVVVALQRARAGLEAALAPWSRGEPTVEVRHEEPAFGRGSLPVAFPQ